MSRTKAAGRRLHRQVDKINAMVGCRIRAARLRHGMSLAQLGGGDLSPSFLSQVERGRSRISLRALAIVAERLELPIGYFFDEHGEADPRLERTDAALAHSLFLHQQGDREGAVHYALRAVVIALREHA